MCWLRSLPRAGVLALLASLCGAQPADPALELARSRDPGIVTLLRHARAPGVGDPAGFDLENCATQRNLSEQGRIQARRLGEALRAVGVRDADVRSSQWCRCLETARLLAVGQVHPATYLNSFRLRQGYGGHVRVRQGYDGHVRVRQGYGGPVGGHHDEAEASTRAMRAAVLQKLDSRRPTFFVTHQVNITALTGVVPGEAEAVFVRATAAGTIEVVGRARLP